MAWTERIKQKSLANGLRLFSPFFSFV